MKNLKKLLAVIITVAMMATMMVPVFAAEEISEDANIVAELELLLGDGDEGVTSEYLAKDTVRIQAAIILLRLLGKLDEALTFEGEENFADADKVWAEGQNVLAYLKANPELGWVGDGENFKPLDQATSQEIYKVMLEVLGYKAGAEGDFTWEETLDFAADNGLELIADVEGVTNDDLAIAIVEALKATNVDEEVLVEKLIADGLVEEDLAIELGLVSGEFVIESAAAIAPDEIKVVFNQAVEAGTKVELVKGLVPYTTINTWSEDLKSVVLKSSFALPAGDYTIKAGELSAAVKVEAQKAVSLTIKSIGLQKINNAKVELALVNQYGKEMPVTGVTVTAYNKTRGLAVPVSGQTVDLSSPAFAVNDVIVVSAIYTTLTTTKEVNIIGVNAADSFEFGTVVLPANQTRLLPSATAYELGYTLINQYGESMKLPIGSPTSGLLGGVMFASTDATVVDPATLSVDANGVLKFTALKEGTVTLTALVSSTGKFHSTVIKVEGPAAIKTISVAAPASLVVAGEPVELPYVAADQYGAQIAAKDIADTLITSGDMSFGTSNSAVIAATNFAFSKGKLTLTPSSAGSATVYVYYKGTLQSSVSFTVEAVAKPVRITGIKDLPSMYEIGSTAAFTKANVIVVDQYNREMKPANYTEAINVAAKDGTFDKVLFDVTDAATGAGTFTAAAAAGSEVVTFSIAGIDASAFDVTMGTIATKDIATYELSAAGTMYQTTSKALALTGKTANGDLVQLATGKVDYTTSTNSTVATIDTNLVVSAKAKGEATVAVWGVGATKLAEVTVTVSDVAPAITTIKFTATTLAAGGDIKTIIKVQDQYGVDIDKNTLVVGTDLFVAGDISKLADEVKVTVISKNGVTAVATIEVTAP